MNETLSYLLAALVLPPNSTSLLALAGVWVRRRHPRLGTALIVLPLVALLLLAMPAVASVLLRSLEPPPLPTSQVHQRQAKAIVILGGGRQLGALEWGGETVNAYTLQRVRYGARLARELSLPVLVTGGTPGRGTRAEAALMRDVLVQELNTEVRWIEDQSLTTRENARLSAALLQPLQPQGICRIVLVTSASHMKRAQANFSAHGFDVLPAPTDYLGQIPQVPLTWNLLVPSVEGLTRSNTALREYLALARDHLFSLLTSMEKRNGETPCP